MGRIIPLAAHIAIITAAASTIVPILATRRIAARSGPKTVSSGATTTTAQPNGATWA